MRRIRQTWAAWMEVTKQIYLAKMKGWPRAEMRRYWEQGMSPLAAYEYAIQRRLNQSESSHKEES